MGAWMRARFADRAAEHESLLRGLPAIVNAVAPQLALAVPPDADSGEAITRTFLRSPSIPPPTSSSIEPPPPAPRRSPTVGSAALLATGVLCAAGAFFLLVRSLEQGGAVPAAWSHLVHDDPPGRPPAASAPDPTGALHVNSNPPGSAIWINGALRPETTPATLDKVALGEDVHVKLVKEGYEVYRTTLRLTDESPTKEVGADLRALPVTVVLQVEPASGTSVWVDGKPWTGSHTTIDGLTPGVEHWLLLASPGYVARMASVAAGPGETTTLTVRLIKEKP
jgi:hypothetical protein